MKEHVILIDDSKCIGCGLCCKDCPENNIRLKNKVHKADILSQNCMKCGHCVAICPKAAVSMTGFEEQPVEFTEASRLDPEQLLDAIRSRRSIRQFKDRPIPSDIISQIIEAGRFTPTGKNAQDVSYIVLQHNISRFEQPAVRLFKRLLPLVRPVYPAAGNVEIDDHFFFKKAPAVLLVITNNKVNGALAASNMALMAESSGLGVLYSGFYTMAVRYSAALRKTLGLKRGDRVAATLVLGYPGVTYRRTVQRDTADVKIL